MIQANNIPLSLYIHIPWCVRKCPYCDFNSHTFSQDLPEQAYIDALLNDLRLDAPLAGQRQLHSIFIGGGTPSLFSGEAIGRLLKGINTIIPLSKGAEVTLEANPGTLESGKFDQYRANGVNRLSIGVQSFDDAALQSLGRIHNSDNAHKAIEATIAAGFERWNLDLMHGLPNQSLASAKADLETALRYKPPHLSWYQLTIEANTAFYSRPPTLPNDDLLADIQDCGEAILAQSGFTQYEVSAYAGNHQCRHNLNYWHFGDYLGIGAGAHGKITQADGSIQRVWKTRQPDSYLKIGSLPSIGAQLENPFVAGKRFVVGQELIFEFFLNSLRLHKPIPLSFFETRTGLSWTGVEQKINKLVDRGLLVQQQQSITTSPLGKRYLNDVLQDFML